MVRGEEERDHALPRGDGMLVPFFSLSSFSLVQLEQKSSLQQHLCSWPTPFPPLLVVCVTATTFLSPLLLPVVWATAATSSTLPQSDHGMLHRCPEETCDTEGWPISSTGEPGQLTSSWERLRAGVGTTHWAHSGAHDMVAWISRGALRFRQRSWRTWDGWGSSGETSSDFRSKLLRVLQVSEPRSSVPECLSGLSISGEYLSNHGHRL